MHFRSVCLGVNDLFKCICILFASFECICILAILAYSEMSNAARYDRERDGTLCTTICSNVEYDGNESVQSGLRWWSCCIIIITHSAYFIILGYTIHDHISIYNMIHYNEDVHNELCVQLSNVVVLDSTVCVYVLMDYDPMWRRSM